MMNTNLYISIILVSIGGLLYTSAWFAGIETALTSISTLQVAKMRKKRMKNVAYVVKLKKDMEATLITILIGNNIVNILLSALVAIFANSFFKLLGVSIALGILTFLIIIFGDIIPKSKAVSLNDRIILRNARMIYYLRLLFSPLIWIFIRLSKAVLKLYHYETKPEKLLVTEQKVKDLILLGLAEGSIEPHEKDFIDKVFSFTDCKVKSIMLPLKDVYCISDKTSAAAARKQIAKRGFTRVPLLNRNKRVTGLIYSKDLLNHRGKTLKTIAREPLHIGKNELISAAFNQMKNQKNHMLVVQDDKGKDIGIITLEDILEELVGDIYDEAFSLKYHK